MAASVSRTSVGTFDAVTLENAYVRAVILPQLGGRVWELEDRARGRQWIWHRPDVPLSASPVGASYDDVWAGGWEELFPNDAPGTFEGRALPDHGEWWTMAWDATCSSTASSAAVRLSASSTVINASCTKEFRLASDASALEVSYRIVSGEREPFHFLFKQHLPVRLEPGSTLRLPGGTVQAVDPSFGTVVPGAAPFAWPRTRHDDGRVADLSIVPPPESRAREFVYVSNLPDSWCGIADPDGASIRVDFDRSAMPYVWLFLTYGGWRDLYTAVLEPCSNMPKELTEAVRLGQAARLDPGQEFRTTVSVTLGGVAKAGV